jgi:hypothetical protein
MGGVCDTNVGEEKHMGFWCGNVKERNHLKALGVEGRIILKWNLKE